MKTTKEILQKIKTLQGSSQTLQPKAVLELLGDLALVVASIEKSIPHKASSEEIEDIFSDKPDSN